MPQIRILPDHLISKIAAGEVVERPSSVIKELVENSLDAGATKIAVTIEKGGQQLLRVTDNGCGMTADEMKLAICRHATSKIQNEADLFNIQTLGFRGEALAAIASVSFMRLESRPATEETGSYLELEGGQIVAQGKISCPPGSSLQIRQLFYNTPARLKFLKKVDTEALHITDILRAYGLALPHIGFSLVRDDKEDLKLHPESFSDRVASVFSAEIVTHLIPFDKSISQIRVWGMSSDVNLTASNTRNLFFFVNGRSVKDRTLQHAVLSAHENGLMKGRFPWTILNLQMPSEYVDVNVHPTKAEVRFTNGGMVHDAVRDVIRNVLQINSGNTATDFSSLRTGPVSGQFPDGFGRHALVRPRHGEQTPSHPFLQRQDPLLNTSDSFQFSKTPLGSLKILGQIKKTYIVCESDEALVLIDQHAAHERIGFEKLKKQFQENGIQSQKLLIPINIDLLPSETEILKRSSSELSIMGLEVDFFGGNTFIIRAVPQVLKKTNYTEMVQDLVSEIGSYDKLTPLREKIYQVLERMACHAQVRAGDSLSFPEMEQLLQDIEIVPFGSCCPHGRPVRVNISWDELEHKFKRKL